jgi:hypothetical protein
MSASKGVVQAYICDGLSWSADEQHLFALVNRMRLFAPSNVMEEAEAVVRKIIEISEQPKLELGELARTTFKERLSPDLLHKFSVISQADLMAVSTSAKRNVVRIVMRATA